MSRIQLTFHGGVDGETTGAHYLLELAKARFYLEAGLFLGALGETEAHNRRLAIDPSTVTAILISHAHLGHCGRLPYLVRSGFRGHIWATPATRDLCAVTLPDAAEMLTVDAARRRQRGWTHAKALYGRAETREVQSLMVGLPYRRPMYLRKNLFFEFHDSGHVAGSASIMVRFEEGKGHRLVYSGDIGRTGMRLVRDPDPPSGPVDTLIMGSSGASATLPSMASVDLALRAIITRVVARGGTILVPALPAGRSQEFLLAVHRLWRDGAIPEIPILIDSARVVGASELLQLHPEIFWREHWGDEDPPELFEFPLVRRRASEVPTTDRPSIIVAGTGSCSYGPVVGHLERLLGDPRHLVLFLHRQPEHTLGQRLQDGLELVEFGEHEVRRQAEVVTLEGFGGHGDREEQRRWLRALGGPIARAFVVHGDDAERQAMALLLESEGVKRVEVPKTGESFRLQG